MSKDPQENAELEQQIVQHVHSEKYQPVKSRVLAKKLGFVTSEERKSFRMVLRRLSKAGKLEFAANHIVRQVGSKKEEETAIVGRYSRTSRGFGFVSPDEGQPHAGQPDIYIAVEDTKDAAHRDKVRIRLVNRTKPTKKGPRGRIVEVVERFRHRFVGTLIDNLRSPAVRLDDKQFARPVSVGDPGAKAAKAGDKVVVEFVRFPTTYDDGDAVIVEVLGARGAPGVDTLTIVHEFELPGDFSDAVLADARTQADRFQPEDLQDRTDLREHLTVTIDPVDARDFDDAISLTQEKNGHWNLGVHIADVAHFVPVGSKLDDEARDRATSVYLPDTVIPMIPETISNHLASLQPHEPRYAKTVWIEFTEAGVPVNTKVEKSVIRSDHRFAYEEVDELLADAEPWREKSSPEIVELVLRMHRLAMLLRQRRRKLGSLELHLPETKIDLDDDGKAAGAHLVEYTESHQVIEEFMLSANEAVATALSDKDFYFLRRVHAPPSPKKMMHLTQFARDLGFKCESLENRFEVQRVLKEAEGQPTQLSLNLAVLRSMQKAIYSPQKEGHYALNSDNYCHFTSPIRRYPDLVIHRAFDEIIAGRRPNANFNQLKTLGDHCSEREKRAEQAERELVKLKLLGLLNDRIGTVMEAVITGVEDFGLFAQGVDLPIDGFLALESLPPDRYHYDPTAHMLWGHQEENQFRLGDKIEVAVARVDLDRRELTLKFSGERGRAALNLRAATDGDRRATSSRPARGRDNDSSGSRGGKRSGSGGGKPHGKYEKDGSPKSKYGKGKSSGGKDGKPKGKGKKPKR